MHYASPRICNQFPDSLVSLISRVITHFLIHLSSHLSHHHHSQHPSLLHFSLQAQNIGLPFPQILPVVIDCCQPRTTFMYNQTGLGLYGLLYSLLYCHAILASSAALAVMRCLSVCVSVRHVRVL